MKRLMWMLCSTLLLLSCQSKGGKTTGAETETADTTRVVLHYAKGFSVDYKDGFCLLQITNPQKKDSAHVKNYRFALVPRGTQPADIPAECTVIETPIKGIVCMTSQQLAGFIKLQALDFVVGIASAKRLKDPELLQRLKDGRIVKIGKEGNFDEELVMASQPDAILISLSKRGGFDKLADSGIPTVPYMGYEEYSPLAQAEWIKFVGLLTGKTAEANQIFAHLEKNYEEAKKLVNGGEKARPTVLYGKMHGDNWYAMGGASYIAQILNDAGATYFMTNDNRTGGVNLDFETVYAQAEACQFWVIQNKGKEPQTYQNMQAEDDHYADFAAWKARKVVCCDVGETPLNELSAMEPDLVLKDFIKAFHPQALNDYQPKYYHLMEK